MAFSGSYDSADVQMLLKPCAIPAVTIAEKERLIQSGARHYSEMLSTEKLPDPRYFALFDQALARNACRVRHDVELLAHAIADRPATARECVLISLARAGTPIGVLVKRALERRGVVAHHYTISIIRDRGIDGNALKFIHARHGADAAIFLDGWTGKGTIRRELDAALADAPSGFRPFLAVVADPAGCADLAATVDDYVIPSGLLNGIVSGLISRSVLTETLVGPDDFHACLFQLDQAPHDRSRAFLAAIEGAAPAATGATPWTVATAAQARADRDALLRELLDRHDVGDMNRIKPGIAEATRAMLRRVPRLLCVSDRADPEVQHLLHLAGQSNVPVQARALGRYRAVTIIQTIAGGGAQE